MTKHLPLILMGSGGLLLTTLFVMRKTKAAPSIDAKVSDKIATSSDPNLLKQLANGLQKTGNPAAAMAALQKAANLTGVSQILPGLPPIQPTAGTSVPTSNGAGVAKASPTVSNYRVAPGD